MLTKPFDDLNRFGKVTIAANDNGRVVNAIESRFEQINSE